MEDLRSVWAAGTSDVEEAEVSKGSLRTHVKYLLITQLTNASGMPHMKKLQQSTAKTLAS